jgi:hypothetical protein
MKKMKSFVIIGPGTSLMRWHWNPDGEQLSMTCPGCGARCDVPDGPTCLEHEVNCAVLDWIEWAQAAPQKGGI